MNNRFQELRLVGLILKIAGGLEMALGVVSVVLIPLVFTGAKNALIQLGVPLVNTGSSDDLWHCVRDHHPVYWSRGWIVDFRIR